MSLAPIVLFVYNRPEHTRRTLEALMKSNLASESTLYIFADGPKQDPTATDAQAIKDVRDLVLKEQWCKNVKIIERKSNLGLAQNVIEGVSVIIKEYGKVIVLEDDIIVGKGFLKFMNESLEYYSDKDEVFGVSGFTYPSNTPILKSSYFLPIASSWSYGTWVNRWESVNFNAKQLLSQFASRRRIKELNFGGYPFYEMLKDNVEGKNNSWAICFYTSMFLKGSYFLYPNESLVANIGFDNSGTHCTEESFFSSVMKTIDFSDWEFYEPVLDFSIVNNVKKKFESQFDLKENNKVNLNKFHRRLKAFVSKKILRR